MIVTLRQFRYNENIMPRNVNKTDIEQAYAEFETGLKVIRKELRDLVVRTIAAIDDKQVQKILQKIKVL